MGKDLLGRAHLLDDTILHDHNPVTQRHGFRLIVGNINEGGVDALAEHQDLSAHLVAQLGIQIGQRFIHQEHLRLSYNGTPDSHTLPLTTGKRLGLAIQQFQNIQTACGFLHLLVNDSLGIFPQTQAIGDVFINRHVGIQRIILKNHGNITVLGQHIVYQTVTNVDITRCRQLQTGNHPQSGRFSAAGGANEHHKFLVPDLQIEGIHCRDGFVKNLADIFK